MLDKWRNFSVEFLWSCCNITVLQPKDVGLCTPHTKIQFLKCALSAIFTWEMQHGLFVNLFHLNTRPILTMQTLNCNKWLCILKFTASLSLLEWYNISGCINVQLTLSFHIFEVLHCNNFPSKHKITGKYFHTKIRNIRLHKRCLISDVTFLLSFFGITVILQYSCQQMAVSALPYQNTILKMCIKCNFYPGEAKWVIC